MRTLASAIHRTSVATALVAGLTSSRFAADQRDEETANWKDRTWGAVELAARYGIPSRDDDAFRGTGAANFADPATSASEARGLTLGVNWYLNRNVKLVANFEHTSFEGGASGAVTGECERAIFTRAQIRYQEIHQPPRQETT